MSFRPPIPGREPLSGEERIAARRRRHQAGIIRSLLFLAALVVLAVVMARRPAGPRVESVITATGLDAAYCAVAATDVYTPDDTFFVSVYLSGYDPRLAISARWRYEGQIIRETLLDTPDAGEGCAGFSLTAQEPPRWPVGRYVVEIVYDGNVLGAAQFRVEE